jgi:hypothetical protein
MKSCCTNDSPVDGYETVKIPQIRDNCPACDNYSEKNKHKDTAVVSCEGACIRGEISRRAANAICHNILSESTVRICLGGGYTKDGGQRNLMRNAKNLVILEGCFLRCASRMIQGILPDTAARVILVDDYYSLDPSAFSINEISESKITELTGKAVAAISQELERIMKIPQKTY